MIKTSFVLSASFQPLVWQQKALERTVEHAATNIIPTACTADLRDSEAVKEMVQTVSYSVEAACSGSVPAKLWLAWQTASPVPSLSPAGTSLVFAHFTRCLHNLKSRTPKHCPSLETAAPATTVNLTHPPICRFNSMEADFLANSMEGIEIDQDKALQVRPDQENAGFPSDVLQVSDDCHLLQANPLTTFLQQVQLGGIDMTSEPAINPKDEV